jgi:hypothetical protein
VWVRDWWVRDVDSEAWQLLDAILANEKAVLTTSAIELFKNRCFPVFNAFVHVGRLKKAGTKRRKKQKS